MTPEEKLLGAILEPEKTFKKELEKTIEDYELLIEGRLLKLKELEEENEKLRKKVKAYRHCCEMVIPDKVYTHKERKNTTVKFLDGSSVTVKRKAGEKDCLETAIAYCILKQLLTAEALKKLIQEKEEH